MPDPPMPKGEYRGQWVYGVFPVDGPPGFFQREGTIRFDPPDDGMGEARIKFQREDGTTFVNTFPVVVVRETGELLLDFLGSREEVFPFTGVEVVRPWRQFPLTHDEGRLSGTAEVLLERTGWEQESHLVHLTFIGELVDDGK